MFKIIALVLIGAVVMIVTLGNIEKADSSTTTTQTTDSSSSSTTSFTLSISGEVNKPGTYYIGEGSTLSDLITSAGGATSNADEKAFNLDYILKNNQSFYIAPIYNNSDTCSQVEIEKVNINEASNEELQTINGVKSSLATAIVSYRTTNGDFQRIEDVKEVSGIGSVTFEKMKNYITLK